MDLILWRHAEADELLNLDMPDEALPLADMQRALTPRGEKQAMRMAAWLDRQLPDGTRILSSPAKRCDHTARTLNRKYKVRSELQPGAMPEHLLELVQWPTFNMPTLVIGHQPTLGMVIAHLLGIQEGECVVKKGAVWWLRSREKLGVRQTVLVTVQTPELL